MTAGMSREILFLDNLTGHCPVAEHSAHLAARQFLHIKFKFLQALDSGSLTQETQAYPGYFSFRE
jgi:hypothetical protein